VREPALGQMDLSSIVRVGVSICMAITSPSSYTGLFEVIAMGGAIGGFGKS
jgi:hypothetical protein